METKYSTLPDIGNNNLLHSEKSVVAWIKTRGLVDEYDFVLRSCCLGISGEKRNVMRKVVARELESSNSYSSHKVSVDLRFSNESFRTIMN